MRKRSKMQGVTLKQNWNKQIKIYHNKGSGHFLVGVASKALIVAGHDLTTHPDLYKNKEPKKRFLKLYKNPNPEDKRTSYLNKKLRTNLSIEFTDTGKRKLTIKKKWKISKKDKSQINKIDRNKI